MTWTPGPPPTLNFPTPPARSPTTDGPDLARPVADPVRAGPPDRPRPREESRGPEEPGPTAPGAEAGGPPRPGEPAQHPGPERPLPRRAQAAEAVDGQLRHPRHDGGLARQRPGAQGIL